MLDLCLNKKNIKYQNLALGQYLDLIQIENKYIMLLLPQKRIESETPRTHWRNELESDEFHAESAYLGTTQLANNVGQNSFRKVLKITE